MSTMTTRVMSSLGRELQAKLDRLKLGLALYRNIMKGKVPTPRQDGGALAWGNAMATLALHLAPIQVPIPWGGEHTHELASHAILNEAHAVAELLHHHAPEEDQVSGMLHMAALLVDLAARHPELEAHRRLWVGTQDELTLSTMRELDGINKPHPTLDERETAGVSS